VSCSSDVGVTTTIFELRRLAQKFGHGFDRIGREGGFKNQNVGGKFCNGGLRLGQSLGLTHYADVVFESEDFAQPGAEDSLGIGQDDANELAEPLSFVGSVIFADATCAGHRFLLFCLCSLEMVFVDHYANASTASIFKAANHAAVAVDLHICGNRRPHREAEW
jgi:hypothetical protein